VFQMSLAITQALELHTHLGNAIMVSSKRLQEEGGGVLKPLGDITTKQVYMRQYHTIYD
jgi:hypothetical protein